MKRRGIQLVLCFFLFLTGHAQSLSKNEIYDLQTILVKFLETHDTKLKDWNTRKQELVMLFLETDTNGRIGNLHLMADEKTKDSTYAILSRITVNDLKEWKGTNCKNKVILVPISSAGNITNETQYTHAIIGELLGPLQRPMKILEEKGSFIIVNTCMYSPPWPNKTHTPERVIITPVQQ